MENIRAFYNDVISKIIQFNSDAKVGHSRSFYKDGAYNVFPSVLIDSDLMYRTLDNITNKFLTLLNNEDRKIYAGLLVKNINAYKVVARELIDDLLHDKVVVEMNSGAYYVKSESEVSIEQNEDIENERLSYLYKEDLHPFESLFFRILCDFGITLDGNSLQEEFPRIDLVDILKSENKSGPTRGQQFTTKRQTLAIVELLSELGINTGSIDKTAIADFIQFLTGRQTELLPQNTTAYKLIERKEPDSKKEIKSFNSDSEFVASYFEKVGLFSLADKVRRGKI